MSTNLYEVLDLKRGATTEEIRKAYKKKALETHPDRLPPDVSERGKQRANERFRLVNNAYGVLTDENNRNLYDLHGIWPPTAKKPEGRSGTSTTDSKNNTSRSRENTAPSGGSPRRPFASHEQPNSSSGGARSSGSSGMAGFAINFTTLKSRGQVGNWVSETTSIQSVGGHIECTTTQRDAEGNVHVTHTTPDGERYTINGVQQPTTGSRNVASGSASPAVTAMFGYVSTPTARRPQRPASTASRNQQHPYAHSRPSHIQHDSSSADPSRRAR